MQKSIVKRKLANGDLVLVPKVCFMDPNIVEMLGLLGFDSVWICNEYKAINPEMFEHMVRAGRAAGIECVIRTGIDGGDDYVRLLSMGANGLMIPHVQTPKQARQIVRRVKYPPIGQRELENINVDADYGLLSLEDYLASANHETLIVLQIEDKKSVERVDEIAEVKGIDVLFVGTSDLALSLGLTGQNKHPKVLKAIRRVVKVCEDNNIVCGAPAIDCEHCRILIDQGVRYFADSSDWHMILSGFRESKKSYAKLGFSFRNGR